MNNLYTRGGIEVEIIYDDDWGTFTAADQAFLVCEIFQILDDEEASEQP